MNKIYRHIKISVGYVGRKIKRIKNGKLAHARIPPESGTAACRRDLQYLENYLDIVMRG